MAHSKDIEDIPKSTVRAVAKKLKYYIDVQRREEAFDLSGVEHPMGAFTSSKGGSLYYNSMQDKLTAHFLSQPHLKKYTSEMGLKSAPTKNSPRPYSAIMNFIKQESTMLQESGKLVNTSSKLLLNSNVKHLDRTGSAPSTLRTPVAAHHLKRPMSSNSTMPSSTISDLASRSYPRKKRSSRQMNQSTPITQSVPIMDSSRTNFQPTIQRIDLGSSISSNASTLQSSVAQSLEDDESLQYTYHGVSRKPSVTDGLFTRSDSALCIPTMQKRVATANKKKATAVVKEATSKETTADITNNNSPSRPLQVNQSTQDASVQVNSSSSSLDQTKDNKAVAQSTAVGRTTAASTSDIGLQVTECRDHCTQTLSEVGIQTDRSAIMDQKRAERRQLKKQSRENSSQDSSSKPPTVIVTSDSTEKLKQEVQSDGVAKSSNSQTEQDLEAARKEELRRHVAATTIQQYYRGFKRGIRAKKSEQEMKEQEISLVKEKKPVGMPIHEAARTGNVDRIKELSTETNSLINLLDERGYTPLHCAVEKGSLESVKMLSICGADMHKETPTGYTAMHIAALSGHVNCLKLLHALECSLKCQSVDRKTPLHLAAMCGHMECCKWLLSNRAKLNVRDENDRTALQLAEDSGQTQIVNLLTSYENELQYAKGVLKQLRARRSSSTEHTDDEGWLSDAKQPESPAIKYPATIVEEQKQFYEQIQKDKGDSDSTFLDVARVAVEKELQATEEHPDQHKLDDQYRQTDDQDQQHINQDQQHIGQDQQHIDQDQQHIDQDQQHIDQDQQYIDQDQQHINQSQQHNDEGQQNNDLDHHSQQSNDQDHQDQQPNNSQDNDQGQSQQNNDQGQQLIDQSQSLQDINDQVNIDEQTEAENQDVTPTDKQLVASQSEVPFQATDAPQTSDATTTKKTNREEADTTAAVQYKVAEDIQEQKDEVTELSSTQNIVTTTDDTSIKPSSPKPATQDAPQELIQETPQELVQDAPQESSQKVKQDTNSQQTLLLDDANGAEAVTESRDKIDIVAELSVANLAAHDVANPPLIERSNTQQTLTSVTMLDNPIRLEQFTNSRSSLDSDYSKRHRHQQIVQTVSTTGVNGDAKPNDDVIAITGTVDTGTVKSSISSSTLSNLTDLTE